MSRIYKTKFPSTMLQTIVAHPKLKDIDAAKINDLILNTIVPKIIQNRNLGLNIKELNSLISSVITLSENKDITTNNINKLLSLLNNKETKTELIDIILALSKNAKPDLITSIILIAPIVEATPELRSIFYSKFGNDNIDGLDIIGKKLNNTPAGFTEDEKKNILIILSKTNLRFESGGTHENKLEALLEKISQIQDKDLRANFLSKIATLTLPVQIKYPNANELIDAITTNKSADDLVKALYDKLEASRNDNVELDKRFDTTEVNRVLETMQNLEHGSNFTYPQKKKLQEQFHIVNHLGRHVELAIDLTNDNSPKKNIKNMDDIDIKNLLSQYRDIIRDQNKSDKEKNSAKLIYLALLRESMYRSTGRFPFSTQILAVLSAMNQNGNNIAEIQTGQGKSLMSSLYAAMLHAEGQPVDIATSNLQLAREGLHENKDFYAYIGVKTGIVTSSMDFSDYHHDGINYSDVPQLALFRSRAFIEGGKLPEKASLVLDEADYTLLDDKTQYRYAANLDPTAPSYNVFAWAYPLINTFVDDPSQSETPENLRAYLMQNAPARYARLIQNREMLTDKQLDTWINSAISASVLYEQKDKAWTLRTEEKNGKKISAAKLISNHTVSKDAQWSNGVQQFVHARINENNKAAIEAGTFPPCPIDPEKSALASLTSKNFLDFYTQRSGKIWGMTGTIGSDDEKREHAEKFGFKLFSLPPHQKEQRVTHDPILLDSDTEHKQAIFNEILKRIRKKDKMPTLIICKDPTTAQELHDFIQSELSKTKKHYPLTLQLISGIKTSQQKFESNVPLAEPDTSLKDDDAIKQASIGGTITISTPMLGRGTDFKPVEQQVDNQTNERKKHPHGLFVIQSYVDIERTSRQVSGRSGRQGAKGEAMTLISKEALEKDLKSVNLKEDIVKKKKLQEYVQNIRNKRNYTATEQRQQTEVLGDIRNLYFNKMLTLLDNVEQHYNAEKDKYNIEMKKENENENERDFSNIDTDMLNKYSDSGLYRVGLLQQWETFLLDLDLKKAELLASNVKLDINHFSIQLITHANRDWREKVKPYNSLLQKPSCISANPLDANVLSSEANKFVKRKHISTEPKPETSSASRRLSTTINPDKLVCRIIEKPDDKLVQKSVSFDLQNIHKDLIKLYKSTRIPKSMYPKDQQLESLYLSLLKVHSEAISKNPNSPKVQQFQALILKLESTINWQIENTADPLKKSELRSALLSHQTEHINYLISKNRLSEALRFQESSAATAPRFGITDELYRSHIKQNSNSITSNSQNRFLLNVKSQNQKLFTNPTSKTLSDRITYCLSLLNNTGVVQSNKTLCNMIVNQRKIAYFGEKDNNLKPISSGDKYHQNLDNLLAGLIASGNKSDIEQAYKAELQDINTIVTYIRFKYANDKTIQSSCNFVLESLEKNNNNPDILIAHLNSLLKVTPSKTLSNTLLSKVDHLQAIQHRKPLFDLKLEAQITPIHITPQVIVEQPLYKKPITFFAQLVSPHRTIIEVRNLPQPIQKNDKNSLGSNPLELSNRESSSISFNAPSGAVMVRLVHNPEATSAEILIAQGVNTSSPDFKSATKKAILELVSRATETTTFKISEKLPPEVQGEFTKYLKDLLKIKFPTISQDDLQAKINPPNPPPSAPRPHSN